jgi:hypothetical protein
MDVIEIINYINAIRRLGGEAESGQEPGSVGQGTGNGTSWRSSLPMWRLRLDAAQAVSIEGV